MDFRKWKGRVPFGCLALATVSMALTQVASTGRAAIGCSLMGCLWFALAWASRKLYTEADASDVEMETLRQELDQFRLDAAHAAAGTALLPPVAATQTWMPPPLPPPLMAPPTGTQMAPPGLSLQPQASTHDDGPAINQIISTLDVLANNAARDPLWGSKFWQWIHKLETRHDLSPRILETLRQYGYQGEGTSVPPIASSLSAALSSLGGSNGGGGLALANAWTTSAQCLHQGTLPSGLRRAAPEIYTKLRSEGCASTRAWLRDNYMGFKGVGSPWNDLWSMASQVDFALAHCASDAQMMAVLNSDDRVETSLRHLGAHFYETRTRDRVGAAEMRAFSIPGAQRDIVPGWMVAEATLFSKSEHQRSERVESEIRRRNYQDKDKGKGRGKGDKDKGKD